MVIGKRLPGIITNRAVGLMELLYPPLCPGCDSAEKWKDKQFCLNCLSHIGTISEKNSKLALTGKDHLPQGMENVYSLFYYHRTGPLKQVLHKIKYRSNHRLAFELGKQLGYKLESATTDDMQLVPVPLHPSRMRKRGYNQAYEIARGMSQAMRVSVLDILRCTKLLVSATQTSKNEREKRLDGIYRTVKSRASITDHLVIVDDVITTGATMKACKDALDKTFKGNYSYASLAITI